MLVIIRRWHYGMIFVVNCMYSPDMGIVLCMLIIDGLTLMLAIGEFDALDLTSRFDGPNLLV